MKYRKKPVVVEARHIETADFGPSVCDWVNSHGGEMSWNHYADGQPPWGYLQTHEGVLRVQVGDYVLHLPNSTFTVVPAALFREGYDLVVDG